jgi:translation initiation factor IF-1
VNRLDQEIAKRRGPTRAVEPFKKKKNNTYTNSVRTSQGTHSVPITTTNRLMLLNEKIAVYCENHMEHINTLCGQNAGLWHFGMLKRVVHIVATAHYRVECMCL